MAVRKINYKDKSPLQTKPEIPEENKVNAEDLNQIKEVVNNNADEIELRQLKEEGKGLSKNDFTDELKAKLESLNNYNDTEIKKEISEINKKVAENTENDIKQDNEILELKTNHTNLQEQNTKLESQIKKDRENMINLEVEGQSIHVKDSSDLEGQLEVLGNMEQDVREGYNLFNNIATNGEYNGVTRIVNKDKSITFNGNSSNNWANYKIGEFKGENKKYYLSGSPKTENFNKIFLTVHNPTGADIAQSKNGSIVEFTPETGITYEVICAIAPNTNLSNINFKPMITTESNKEKPYEQYGVSPSPEYPSEIRAVGDNINLLENKAKTTTVNGVTFTANEDGTVIANGTATSLAQISLVANVKLPAGTYTIKDGKAYVESTEFNDWFDGLNNPSTLTFNTEVLLKNVYIQVKQGETVNNKIFYPKLEKGTEATSYSKFGQGSVEIKKQNKNLAPKLKDGKLEKQNTFICNCKKGESFTLSTKGTAEKDGRLFLRTNTDFAKETDSYAEQKEITLNGTEQKITITSTIDGFLYIRTGGAAHVYNFTYLQIEKGTVATEYIEHQEETKILPIQQPMLEGDYFIKEADGWKEVHGWGEVKLTGTENWTASTLIVAGYFGTYLKIQDVPKNTELYCNYFKKRQAEDWHKLVAQNFIYAENGSIGIRINNKFCENLELFKNWLKSKNNLGNPVYVDYKREIPTKIPCTPEQAEVLDQLDNFPTYKPVTNITTDSIAKLKLKYIADTKTYIDNKTSNLEQQVSVINQLLSTTKTSSVLLDNLQSDIESEVL